MCEFYIAKITPVNNGPNNPLLTKNPLFLNVPESEEIAIYLNSTLGKQLQAYFSKCKKPYKVFTLGRHETGPALINGNRIIIGTNQPEDIIRVSDITVGYVDHTVHTVNTLHTFTYEMKNNLITTRLSPVSSIGKKLYEYIDQGLLNPPCYIDIRETPTTIEWIAPPCKDEPGVLRKVLLEDYNTL